VVPPYPHYGYTRDIIEGGDTTVSEKRKFDGARVYRIRVEGKLDQRWSEWFADLEIDVESREPPVTVLRGRVDQATLRGVLNRVWDLNMTVISVES